jgi:hypothetical protein
MNFERRKKLNYGLFRCCDPHRGLFLYHRRRAAAERHEWGHFGGIWRAGQPNGVRSEGRGQRAFESDDLVSGVVRGYVDHAFYLCLAAGGPDVGAAGHQDAAGEDAAGGSGADAGESDAEVGEGERAGC